MDISELKRNKRFWRSSFDDDDGDDDDGKCSHSLTSEVSRTSLAFTTHLNQTQIEFILSSYFFISLKVSIYYEFECEFFKAEERN